MAWGADASFARHRGDSARAPGAGAHQHAAAALGQLLVVARAVPVAVFSVCPWEAVRAGFPSRARGRGAKLGRRVFGGWCLRRVL